MSSTNKEPGVKSTRAAPDSPEVLTDAVQEVAENTTWCLKLYIAGQTAKSRHALDNLTKLCEAHMKESYRIEVIDLQKNPQLAAADQILAIPTLVRRIPEPIRKIIGDLSNTERVLAGLDLRPGD